MVNLGFVLLPLYIYPLPNAWTPLFNAANSYPDLTFLVVINIENGPGASACPNSDYTSAIHSLNSHSNIVALGYVHTASRYNCGASGKDICPATRSQADLQAEINKYQKWSSSTAAGGCGSPSIHVNGIFFDEAPTVAANVTYMQTISTYARNTLTNGHTIVFNTGSAVDTGYWTWADFINVFEDTEAAYDVADIGALDGNGVYSEKTTLIIHTYTSSLATEERDVDTIIDSDHDNIAGVFITERTVAQNPYNAFPAKWNELCQYVDAAN